MEGVLAQVALSGGKPRLASDDDPSVSQITAMGFSPNAAKKALHLCGAPPCSLASPLINRVIRSGVFGAYQVLGLCIFAHVRTQGNSTAVGPWRCGPRCFYSMHRSSITYVSPFHVPVGVLELRCNTL